MNLRGKTLLGYGDAELSTLGGYDLVHYDDLAYVASAHQEREYRFVLLLCLALLAPLMSSPPGRKLSPIRQGKIGAGTR